MDTKKLVRDIYMFNKSITKVPKLEVGEYAILTPKDRLKKIHPLKVSYEGVTYGTLKEYHEKIQQELIDLQSYLKTNEDALISILVDGGYNTPNVDIKSLIEDITHLKIIKPQLDYELFTENEDGYVNGSVDLKGEILIKGDKPEDYDKGYWRIVDGKWVLDQVRYNQYWGL